MTCTLSSNNNPSNVGENVSFRLFANATTFSGPTGVVGFFDGANPIPFATEILLPDGPTLDRSTLFANTSSLSTGTHVITAAILIPGPGTTPCPGLPPPMVQVVKSAQSCTVLTSSVNPTVFGQSTTSSATVTKPGGGTPTGTVQFGVDGSPFGAPQSVDASGVTTISTAALSVGAHSVTASFASDSPATLNSDATLAGDQQGTPPRRPLASRHRGTRPRSVWRSPSPRT